MRIDTPTVQLPPGRDIIDVFGDFLRYMYDCVRMHIINTHVDGNRLWSSLNGTAHFVLSHPNGWGSYQQGKMRDAAIRGGLIRNTPEDRERIEFVTEGEASFHWCVEQAIAGGALKEGTNIVVADLGGGTIDVSSFLVKTPRPLRLQEQMAPDCSLAGSITVTDRFDPHAKLLTGKLHGTPYGDDDYMLTLREEFDEDTKCLFRDDGDSEVYIRIGGRRDNFEDENGLCKIEFGLLEAQRQDIVDAFEPSVAATVNAIRKHIAGRRDAGQVVKVDSVYTEHVNSRACRTPESVTWSQSIQRYNGTRSNITFTDMDPSAFDYIGWFHCEIPASAMTRRTGAHGAYWAVEYDIVITLGTVEIKAHVEWEENGIKKKTPANSMWEDYY
ncbi:hypothetical protein FRC04_001051 [Tulasnella sp. 424]|nr:hypothetical protein FRC04_001051 [Tulasnella sp. 424]KAG8977959.1 hypothetical protein FRC05_000487 [Tulasnella sp. 425]